MCAPRGFAARPLTQCEAGGGRVAGLAAGPAGSDRDRPQRQQGAGKRSGALFGEGRSAGRKAGVEREARAQQVVCLSVKGQRHNYVMHTRPSSLKLAEEKELRSGPNRSWLTRVVPALVRKVNGASAKPRNVMAFYCNGDSEEVHELNVDLSSNQTDGERWAAITKHLSAKSLAGMSALLIVKSMTKHASTCPRGDGECDEVALMQALSGSVGECCEDDDEDEFLNAPIGRGARGHHIHGEPSIAAPGRAETQRSFGVVLQTPCLDSECDGCYILRTSASVSTGCTCTHYSLSRAVCNVDGSFMPLAKQLDSAWLVK